MPEKIRLDAIEIYEPRKLVLEALAYISSGSVLDLGSGFGRHALLLAEKGFEVTAVDSDSQRLESLQQKSAQINASIHTIESDIRNFDSQGKQYNLVLSTMVLHFLGSYGEMIAAVKKMQDSTKTGGIDVICSYTDKSQNDLRPYLLNGKELKNLYTDWEILRFEECKGTDASIDGPEKGKMIWRVEMLARKK